MAQGHNLLPGLSRQLTNAHGSGHRFREQGTGHEDATTAHTSITQAPGCGFTHHDSPRVLDITGSAELSTRMDTQFPMICREQGDTAVTQ